MKTPSALLGLGIVILLALNLRPVMAALGPVLDLVEQSTGINAAGAGMLTTVPIFLMGVGAYACTPLRRLLGERGGIALGMALIAVACAARLVWHDSAGMMLTAASAGLGIAMVQALVPGVIKHWFGDNAGRAMGLYSTGIMAGAAFAAATSAGLAYAAGWPASLAIWAIPATLALFFWLALPNQNISPQNITPSIRKSFWLSRRAWLLTAFFGVGTGAYTLVLAWLPPFYMEHGISRDVSGYLLAGLTVTEVLAGLGVSALIGKFPDRRPLIISALLCQLAGIASLIFVPTASPLLTILLLGVGIGALFPLSLIITMDHAGSPAEATDLSAFVQGGGYIIASTMPLLAGLIKDRFADLAYAWAIMAVGVVALIIMSCRFSPASISRTRTHPPELKTLS